MGCNALDYGVGVFYEGQACWRVCWSFNCAKLKIELMLKIKWYIYLLLYLQQILVADFTTVSDAWYFNNPLLQDTNSKLYQSRYMTSLSCTWSSIWCNTLCEFFNWLLCFSNQSQEVVLLDIVTLMHNRLALKQHILADQHFDFQSFLLFLFPFRRNYTLVIMKQWHLHIVVN